MKLLLLRTTGVLMIGGLGYSAAQNGQTGTRTNVFGVGDVMRVSFAHTPTTLPPIRDVVSTNGIVTLLFSQQFNVIGQTASEVEKEIRKRYVPEYYANLEAQVRLLRTDDFFYLNDKKLSCSAASTILEAIHPHGNDFSRFSDFNKGISRVMVFHANGTSENLEFKDPNDPRLNLEILPGDKVYTFPEKIPPQWKPAPPESKPGVRAEAGPQLHM